MKLWAIGHRPYGEMVAARRFIALHGFIPGHRRLDATKADKRASGADRTALSPNPLQGVEVAGGVIAQGQADLADGFAEAVLRREEL